MLNSNGVYEYMLFCVYDRGSEECLGWFTDRNKLFAVAEDYYSNMDDERDPFRLFCCHGNIIDDDGTFEHEEYIPDIYVGRYE